MPAIEQTTGADFRKDYFTGDGARAIRTAIFGCSVASTMCINVAGHRISTMEVESALVDHQKVAEAAVIGKEHEIKGQAICAFVSVNPVIDGSDALIDELKAHVAKRSALSPGPMKFSSRRNA